MKSPPLERWWGEVEIEGKDVGRGGEGRVAARRDGPIKVRQIPGTGRAHPGPCSLQEWGSRIQIRRNAL